MIRLHHIVLLLLLLLLVAGRGPVYAQNNALPVLTRELSLQPTTSGTLTTLTNKSTGGGLIINTLPLTTNLNDEKVLLINGSNEVTQITLTNLFGGTAWRLTGNSGTDSTTAFIGTTDAQPLVIRTNNIERMRVTSAGNVGIGTSSPNAPLQFGNTVASRKVVMWDEQNNDNQFYGFGVNNGVLRYQTANTSAAHVFFSGVSGSTSQELMRINGNGNVGIGDASPVTMFTVGSGGAFRVTSSGAIAAATGITANGTIALNTQVVAATTIGNTTTGTSVTINTGPSGGLTLGGIPTGGSTEDVLLINANSQVTRTTRAALFAGSGWALSGNASTTGSNYIGTSDAQPLSIRTNGVARVSLSAIGAITVTGGNIATQGTPAPGIILTAGTNTSTSSVAGTNGGAITLMGGATSGSTTNNAGGAVTLVGGSGNTSSTSLGGDIVLFSGNAKDEASRGAVRIGVGGDDDDDGAGQLEVIRITPTGNVGIGMTNPARKLDVTGTFGATGAATLGSTLSVTGLITGNAGATINGATGITGATTINTTGSASTTIGNATTSGTTTIATNGATGRLAITGLPTGTTDDVLLVNSTNGQVSRVTQANLFGNAGWALTGNSYTNSGGALGAAPTGTFLGSTNTYTSTQDNGIRFATNNVVRAIITRDGQLSTQQDVLANGLTVGRGGGGNITNVAIGREAFFSNTAGSTSNNVAIGNQAMYTTTAGTNNVAVGHRAMFLHTSSSQNAAVGSSALYATTTGTNNAAFGHTALENNTTGINNSAFGSTSLNSITTANRNTAVGFMTMSAMTSGDNNVALGWDAGRIMSTGPIVLTMNNSVLLGAQAKPLADNGTNEIVIGHNANGLGSNSAVLGNSSITATRLQGRVGIGANPTVVAGDAQLQVTAAAAANRGLTITGAASQTANLFEARDNAGAAQFSIGPAGATTIGGTLTLSSVVAGVAADDVLLINSSNQVTKTTRANLFAGSGWALTGNTGTDPASNFVGTTDAKDLVFRTGNTERVRIENSSGRLKTQADAQINGLLVGRGGGSVATNVAIGGLGDNTTGSNNIAIGDRALSKNTTGANNIVLGVDAGRDNLTGSENVVIGQTAMLTNTGSENVAIGHIAGRYSASGEMSIANNSVFLGRNTRAADNNQTNQIVIGHNTVGLGSNTVVLGNSSIVTTALRGNVLINNSGSSAGQVRFLEGSSGADYVAIQSPASLAAPYTLTLPADDGDANQVLTTNGSGVMSWSTVAQVSVAGTTDRVAKFTSASTIGNSRISDGSTTLTIGTENISSIEIGTAQTTGTITIGGTSGTGLISIGGGTSPSRADIEIGRNGYKWIQVGSESNVDNRVILVGRGEAAVTAYGTFSVRPTQSDNSLVAPALRLMERHQGVGTPNYVALKSPNDLTANYTLEFPAHDGDANQVLTTDGSGVLSWTTPLTSATGWSLTGNTGTNATTNFLGTTDNQDVVFKRFNIEAFRITTDSLSFSTSRDVFINGVRAGRGGSGGFTGFVSNTVFGSDAMTSVFGGATAEKNSAFGRRALYAVTMGGDNTAVGFGALEFTTTGSHNTALGSGAIGLSTTGSQNVAVGWRAMYNTGASSISSSTAIGYEAGRYVNGANGLTAVGYGALSGATTTSVTGTNNTALGLQAGASVTTGSNNLFLGAASSIGTGSDNNSIVIGYNATGIGSNTVVLGNSSIVTTALRGNVLINNSGASAGQVRFLEGSAGMDYAAIQAPASLAAPYTLTLPANDGDANQVLTTDGSGTLSWTTPSTSVPLSSITAATADNTINSGDNEQEWQWNSLGLNRQGLTLSSSSTTVGGPSWRVLRVRANGSTNTSASPIALEVENSTTDGALAPVNTGAYVWSSNGSDNRGVIAEARSTIANTSNTGLLGTATSSANVTTNYGVRGTVDVTAGTNTTAYAGYFTSAPSGTGAITTNVAGYFSATGGANNYAIIVPASSGTVGIGTTTPAVSMDINGGLAVQPGAQVDITADNQLVTIGNRSSVIVSSNNTPANRTITLSNGLQTGQILYIMVTGTAAGNGVEIVDDPVGANTNLTGLAQLLGGAVMQLIWDGNDWREVSRSNN